MWNFNHIQYHKGEMYNAIKSQNKKFSQCFRKGFPWGRDIWTKFWLEAIQKGTMGSEWNHFRGKKDSMYCETVQGGRVQRAKDGVIKMRLERWVGTVQYSIKHFGLYPKSQGKPWKCFKQVVWWSKHQIHVLKDCCSCQVWRTDCRGEKCCGELG